MKSSKLYSSKLPVLRPRWHDSAWDLQPSRTLDRSRRPRLNQLKREVLMLSMEDLPTTQMGRLGSLCVLVHPLLGGRTDKLLCRVPAALTLSWQRATRQPLASSQPVILHSPKHHSQSPTTPTQNHHHFLPSYPASSNTISYNSLSSSLFPPSPSSTSDASMPTWSWHHTTVLYITLLLCSTCSSHSAVGTLTPKATSLVRSVRTQRMCPRGAMCI